MSRSFRFGVLGVAGINTAALPGIQAAAGCELVAIGSRRGGVAAAEAKRRGIARAYGSYEQVLADPDVDAVYIPLPNHLHVEWTLRALAMGKHVLCEKPLSLSTDGVTAIQAAMVSHRRHVLDAFMYRYAPRWRRAIEVVSSRALGELGMVRIALGFLVHPPGYNIRFDPNVGGGVIWDLGCYGVDMARALLGENPRRVFTSATTRPGSAVETTAHLILEFPSGAHALVSASFDYRNPFSQVEVIGSEGWMLLPGTGMRNEDMTKLLVYRDSRELFTGSAQPEEEVFAHIDTYALEAEALAQLVQSGPPSAEALRDTLVNTAALVAAHASLRRNAPVDIEIGG